MMSTNEARLTDGDEFSVFIGEERLSLSVILEHAQPTPSYHGQTTARLPSGHSRTN
jgi:hypothetical protein